MHLDIAQISTQTDIDENLEQMQNEIITCVKEQQKNTPRPSRNSLPPEILYKIKQR